MNHDALAAKIAAKLDQIETLCNSATPGPWDCCDGQLFAPGENPNYSTTICLYFDRCDDDFPNAEANIAMHIASRTLLPAAVTYMRSLLERWKQAHDRNGKEWEVNLVQCTDCCHVGDCTTWHNRGETQDGEHVYECPACACWYETVDMPNEYLDAELEHLAAALGIKETP